MPVMVDQNVFDLLEFGSENIILQGVSSFQYPNCEGPKQIEYSTAKRAQNVETSSIQG